MAHLGPWFTLLALALHAAPAVGDPPVRPAFRQDRSDEDWREFRAPDSADSADRVDGADATDRLKNLSLGREGFSLTLAGELRGAFERYQHPDWGRAPEDDDGYFLRRLTVSGHFHLGRQTRAFLELRSSFAHGREGGPRPSQDRDTLDVGQLFVAWQTAAEGSARPLLELKLGRQELSYGEGSLLAIRDLNVRRPFDGMKVMLFPGRGWQVDLLALRPTRLREGRFDDDFDTTRGLWGVWAKKPLSGAFLTEVETYFLVLERDHAVYWQGAGEERRQTVGVNLHGRRGALRSFSELDLQFGRLGPGRIRAWKAVQRLDWSWPDRRLRPLLRLQGAISSGDREPTSPDLETFHPLFPRGLYYGRLDSSGSLNAVVLHPEVELTLHPTLTLGASVFWFRRHNVHDGLYSQAGQPLRNAPDSRARDVGRLHELALRWRPNRHTTVEVLGATYEAGEFLRQASPRGRDMTFFSLIWQYRF